MGSSVLAASSLTAILPIIFGSGFGVIGVVIALVKFPSDKSTAAVVQAQGAADAINEALGAVERERDYWKNRYQEQLARNRELVALLGKRTRNGD